MTRVTLSVSFDSIVEFRRHPSKPFPRSRLPTRVAPEHPAKASVTASESPQA
jgi:hypothetical protein